MSNHPLQSSGPIAFSDIEKEKLFDGDEAKTMEDMVIELDAINDIVLNEFSPPHEEIEAGPPYHVSDWYSYNHLATGHGTDEVTEIIGMIYNVNNGSGNDGVYKNSLKQISACTEFISNNLPTEDIDVSVVTIGRSGIYFGFGDLEPEIQLTNFDFGESLDLTHGYGSGKLRCYLKFPTTGLTLKELSQVNIRITGEVITYHTRIYHDTTIYDYLKPGRFVLVYYSDLKINTNEWMSPQNNRIISNDLVTYTNGEMQWTLSSYGMSLLKAIINDPFAIDPYFRVGIVEYDHDYLKNLWFGISEVVGNNSTFDTIGSWGKWEAESSNASVTGGVVDGNRKCMKLINSTVTEYPLAAALSYSALPTIHTDDFFIVSFDYKWIEPLTGILKKSHLHLGEQNIGCGLLEKAMFGSSVSGWSREWTKASRIEKFNDDDPFYDNLYLFTLEGGSQSATDPPTTLLIDNFEFLNLGTFSDNIYKVHYMGGLNFTNPILEVTLTVAQVPTVTTTAITVYTNVTADVGGNCTSDNGASIEEVGICYSHSNEVPTITDSVLDCGVSLGSFSGTISGLTQNYLYYFRAYAKNSAGVGYGDVVSITTKTVPTVVTMDVSSIVSILTGGAENESTSEFDCGITITSNGGGTISYSGLVGNVVNPPTSGHLWYNIPAATTPFYKHCNDALLNNSYPTFYIRAFATNEYGTAYGDVKSFTADFTGLSTVITETATSISNTSASSGGTVTNEGTSSVTDRGVCWGTSSNPTIIANSHTHNGTGTGYFASSLSSLSPSTIYYYRAYAVNSSGTAYGDNLYFITTNSSVASVVTVSVSSITQTTASSGGNGISDGGSSITHKGVCWNTLTNPTIANSHTDDGTGTGSFTSSITGLTAGYSYYVRAYVTNGVNTYYGSNVFFTTLGNPASIVTSDATNIGKTTVTVGGESISDGGSSITDRGVAYGTSVNPTISGNHVHSGSGNANFTIGLTGLIENTTYHIRAFVINNSQADPYYGSDKTFTTTSNIAPVIVTSTPSNILNTSLTAGGNVVDDGGSTVTERGICWNGTGNPTIADSVQTMGSGTGTFSASITSLTENAVYYLKAYAINSTDISYGEEKVVTMKGKPQLITINEVTAITSNSATCGGAVGYDGGSIVFARGVCWNTNPAVDPTTSDSLTVDGTGTGLFTSSLTGLSASTTYYVRAYAINSYGTTYSTIKKTFYTIGTGGRAGVLTTPTFLYQALGPLFFSKITDLGDPIGTTFNICWGTSANPTIAGSHVTAYKNTDTSPQQVYGTIPTASLTLGTTYHIRVYMTDGTWTTYSPDITYVHRVIPTLVLGNIAWDPDLGSIWIYCLLTSDGGGTITHYGYQRGTVSGSYTPINWSNGTLPEIIPWYSVFSVGVRYYIRIAAQNEVGIGYSNEYTFIMN